jgi:transcriptional regulator with XRE-family HTH domain
VGRPRHPSEIYREIAARIRAARLSAGMTQEEAAAAAGIGYKRWQDLEAGRTNTTVLTLTRVATALRTDFWTIVRRGTTARRSR